MDCDKFDQHVIAALYDELDELTYAALKRHVDGCSRCAGVFSGLRSAREMGVLPLEEPSEDLEARILDAVTIAQRTAPWPRKVLRGLAWAGSHAMRPQLAMAALFFLVIGSSLLLLRARPGTMGAPVRVTERGEPSPEQASPVSLEAARTPEPTSAPMAAAKASDEKPEERKAKSDADMAKAALADARAERSGTGCSAAVSKYDGVGSRYPGTAAAADAMWEEAGCYESTGDADKARQLYRALASSGSYRERAEQKLALDGNVGGPASNQMAARASAPAPPAAPKAAMAASRPMPAAVAASPAATAAPAAKPADESRVGAGGKGQAAPAKGVLDAAY